ncbi:MAG: PAS domain S-box protein, partial [Pseudomonadota bacterium]
MRENIIGRLYYSDDMGSEQGTINLVRAQFVDVILLAITIIGLPVLSACIYRAVELDLGTHVIIYIPLYLAAPFAVVFRRRLGFIARALIALSIPLGVGAIGILEWGLLGMGLSVLTAFPVLTGIVFGARVGMLCIGVTTGAVGLIGLSIISGWLRHAWEPLAFVTAPAFWVGATTMAAVVPATIIAGLGRLQTSLVETIKELRERTVQLQESNRLLECRMAEGKLAEDALRQSELLYRTLVNNIPQRVFLKDVESRYISCNAACAVAMGLKAVEIAGKTDYDLFPKELADKYRSGDAQIIDSGNQSEFEEQFFHDGEVRWVSTSKTPIKDESGQVVAVLGIFWDVTERKRAQQELLAAYDELEERVRFRTNELAGANQDLTREIADRQRAENALRLSEHRLRGIFDQSIAAIAVTDPKGSFIQANPALQDFLGYGSDALTGMNLRDVMVADDYGAIGDRIDELIRRRIPGVRMEVRYIRNDGSVVWGSTHLAALKDQSNDVSGMIAVIQDVTHAKMTEKELIEARRLAETAN